MIDDALAFRLRARLDAAPSVRIGGDDKMVVFGDLHMGDGGQRDDLVRNGDLLRQALADWYLPGNYVLVLNGDIEEIQRFHYFPIRDRWAQLFALFDRFAAAGGFHKITGNHDDELRAVASYPYPLLDALRVDTDRIPLFIYHGHQASRLYTRHNRLLRSAVRYLLHPIGITNITSARNRKRRFAVEKAVYDFSRRNGLVSIISHTHRPLFESLALYDLLRFEIDRLCRDYSLADDRGRAAIAQRVLLLRRELKKLKRKERKSSIKNTLYGDELPIPCVFNTGSTISKKGITVLEIEANRISLVYWYRGDGSKRLLRPAMGMPMPLDNFTHRIVLNSETLDYVKARIELLA